MGFGDDKGVDIELMVVLGIGDRRFQRLLDVAGNTLAREGQVSQSAGDRLAAYRRRNQVQLARADPQHARDGLGFVFGKNAFAFLLTHRQLLLAFLSAA